MIRLRAKPFEDVLIAIAQFALQLTLVRPEIIWNHSSKICSVLLTDILPIVFKPLVFISVTHTSKLMIHNHDNTLPFCLSGEVFVDDCVLQFQKAERFD